MKKLIFFVLVIIAGILQVSALSVVSLWGVRPDLLLIMVVIASFLFDFKFVLSVGVAAGAWKDIFGVGAYGMHTLIMVVLALSVAVFVKKISGDTLRVRMVVMALAVLCQGIMVQIVYSFGGNAVPAGNALRIIVVEAVYTALFFALLFGPIAALACACKDSQHPDLDRDDDSNDEDEPDRDGVLY